MSIKDSIIELKKQKNAVILAHNYQTDDIQEIADFVGDSYALSKIARDTDSEIIVFCGVKFMAETAKILNPQKTVLLPAINAGCPMADMVTEDDVLKLREKYPDAAVVCYVNSSAEVKAVSDICCTSSNAVKVVKSLKQKQIIFVPDENLASYVASLVPEKDIILYNGYCIVHKRVTKDDVIASKNAVPEGQILVHPECVPEVVSMADFVGSTAQIIEHAKKSAHKTFIIGTEQGVIHCLQKENPDKKFYSLSPKLICANMKKTTLNDVFNSLTEMKYEINVSHDIMKKAYNTLEKMLKIQ